MENTIDELTLKLMSNKSQYNKYLSKSNPEKYKETTDYLEKRNKYSSDIMNTVKSILFSNKDVTNNVNESFEHFVKECIKYYQMKSLEKKTESDSDDDDVLFGKIDNTNKDDDDNTPNSKVTNKNISNYAYWGKKDSSMNPNMNMSNYMHGISP